jgi:hypothetical protein
LGVHADERRSDPSTPQPAITAISDLAGLPEIWPEGSPNEGLLARISRDAAASDVLGRVLSGRAFDGCIPSPLARTAPSDFGRFQSNQALLDELGAEADPTVSSSEGLRRR